MEREVGCVDYSRCNHAEHLPRFLLCVQMEEMSENMQARVAEAVHQLEAAAQAEEEATARRLEQELLQLQVCAGCDENTRCTCCNHRA